MVTAPSPQRAASAEERARLVDAVTLTVEATRIDNYKELKNYKALIKDGKLCTRESVEETYQPLVTDKFKLFIINEYEDIYLCDVKENYKHTSLSKGKPILGAGLIQVEDGKITYLCNDSGHYLPKIPHIKQTVQILENKNLFKNDDIIFTYYIDFNQIQTTLKKFKNL